MLQEAGKPVRKFANLKLEFTRVNLLTTSWTIVHPIDDESPMLGWSADDFVNNRTELLVLLQAYEETFANNVHSRTSYKANEIVVGARFISMLDAVKKDPLPFTWTGSPPTSRRHFRSNPVPGVLLFRETPFVRLRMSSMVRNNAGTWSIF
ncbi:hypothetical protein [Candidatus Pollutiaquabacter sp.]|uniref:hypothetical protein n=1 Tax=Candidatus Pollutiaquabacter sp. TaxID=3416354 RepID=UPI003D0C8A4D